MTMSALSLLGLNMMLCLLKVVPLWWCNLNLFNLLRLTQEMRMNLRPTATAYESILGSDLHPASSGALTSTPAAGDVMRALTNYAEGSAPAAGETDDRIFDLTSMPYPVK